ncbi:MAG: hypothetical protein NXI15_11655 [Gammaproteobacteria bacterium]|nr:hypothetical protein [Gammaproteobacteria bacterium]
MNRTVNRQKVLVASGAALAAALALLVTVVLPAEYGWDPLGSGKALGLTGLATEKSTALVAQVGPWQQDRRTFHLAPFESVEFKYRLQSGDVLLFQWQSSAELVAELHAEPDGAAPGYAETFDKSRKRQAAGSYHAVFTGLHGWFWQNRTQQNATLTLQTNGYFEQAREFRDGREFTYAFAPTNPARVSATGQVDPAAQKAGEQQKP